MLTRNNKKRTLSTNDNSVNPVPVKPPKNSKNNTTKKIITKKRNASKNTRFIVNNIHRDLTLGFTFAILAESSLSSFRSSPHLWAREGVFNRIPPYTIKLPIPKKKNKTLLVITTSFNGYNEPFSTQCNIFNNRSTDHSMSGPGSINTIKVIRTTSATPQIILHVIVFISFIKDRAKLLSSEQQASSILTFLASLTQVTRFISIDPHCVIS